MAMASIARGQPGPDPAVYFPIIASTVPAPQCSQAATADRCVFSGVGRLGIGFAGRLSNRRAKRGPRGGEPISARLLDPWRRARWLPRADRTGTYGAGRFW